MPKQQLWELYWRVETIPISKDEQSTGVELSFAVRSAEVITELCPASEILLGCRSSGQRDQDNIESEYQRRQSLCAESAYDEECLLPAISDTSSGNGNEIVYRAAGHDESLWSRLDDCSSFKARVLIVSDKDKTCTALFNCLHNEGYQVVFATDHDTGIKTAARTQFDLLILDVTTPERSGLEVCLELRSTGATVPILMLTPRSRLEYGIQGLKLGADDFLGVPLDGSEFIARIEALIRRSRVYCSAFTSIYLVKELRIDLGNKTLSRRGKLIRLPPREFQLLEYLVIRRGRTVKRSDILQNVWGYAVGVFTRTLDVHIAALRRKVEPNPQRPSLILTVPGFGYRFTSE